MRPFAFVAKCQAKNIESGVRVKMLANTITGRKVAREIEEADQVVKEGLTDEEKKAADVVKEWNMTYKEAMEKELNTEVVIDWNKLTEDELMKLADGNSMSLDEMALLRDTLV